MLLLGVDSRTKQLTGRTDTIMFVTIDPNTGKVSMASLPRDMVFVPIAPGQDVRQRQYPCQRPVRVPGRLWWRAQGALQAHGQGHGVHVGHRDRPVRHDRLPGRPHLVDEIGGVDVKLARPLVDDYMHVRMKGRKA